MPRMETLWTFATAEGLPRRACTVAVVVGTVLNIINQGDMIISGGTINWLKLLLTYLVPYGVCTYGAVSAQLVQSKKMTR